MAVTAAVAGTVLGAVKTLSLPGVDLGQMAADAGKSLLDTLMFGLWNAGLTILRYAFTAVDAFTNPDLSAGGPLRDVLPTTLWLGGSLAGVMFFVQIALALVRRDGQSIGRVFLGIAQLAVVSSAFTTVAVAVVAAAGGLEHGILTATVHAPNLASFDPSATGLRKVSGGADGIVLGITSLLMLIPAGFAYILVAVVRDGALIVLVATAPISAAGLVSDAGRPWFWKTLRWFLAAAGIAPCSALVLGIGVSVSAAVARGVGAADASTVGTAVVGAGLMLVGAISPLVLFRLLAFVEPSTASGAAMRQAWSDFGGTFDRGATGSSGSAAAGDGGGRSQGEATADTATASRMSQALGLIGTGIQATVGIANRAVDVGGDVLSSAGVGSPGYSMTPADERALRASRAARSSGGTSGGSSDDPGPDPAPPTGLPPAPSAPPAGPGAPGIGSPAGGSPGSGPAGTAGAGGGGAASAAEAGLVIA